MSIGKWTDDRDVRPAR